MAVAPFIDHWAMVTREGEAAKLQAWLNDNEERLASAMPEGSRWLGVYAEVIGGKGPGWWHVLIGCDSYGALDLIAEVGRDENTEFAKLIKDFFAFFDQTSQAPGGRWFWRAATTAKIWE